MIPKISMIIRQRMHKPNHTINIHKLTKINQKQLKVSVSYSSSSIVDTVLTKLLNSLPLDMKFSSQPVDGDRWKCIHLEPGTLMTNYNNNK